MTTKVKYMYCYRSGDVYFGFRVPPGAIVIAKNPDLTDHEWQERMTARCRHGYEPGVLLVPGIPEATTDDEAMNALVKFTEWCNS
jgi:hypothetical protein